MSGREEESSDTVPAGSVTRTDPAAETELQEGQSVTVYVSLGSGKMPELKNQSKENAKSILDAMNLNLRITYLEEESDDIASGNVTRTVPASDSQLSRGQQVTVYVSKGSGKVTVPPVTGLSVRDAIDLLTENGLKYEIKRVYSDTDEKDRRRAAERGGKFQGCQGHDRDARGLGRPRADGGPDGSARPPRRRSRSRRRNPLNRETEHGAWTHRQGAQRILLCRQRERHTHAVPRPRPLPQGADVAARR